MIVLFEASRLLSFESLSLRIQVKNSTIIPELKEAMFYIRGKSMRPEMVLEE